VTRARRRIAVVLGGRSSEHAISVASAESVIEALADAHDVVTVEIARDGTWALGSASSETRRLAARASAGVSETDTSGVRTLDTSRTDTHAGLAAAGRLPDRGVAAALADVDVVFPVLHGPFGEDGTLQGLLELAGVPFVGAGVLASALCMDKDVFKSVMRDHGIPVTRNVTLRTADEPRNPFGYPVFVKPARLGSSVGITKAHDDRELEAAVELAFEHDEKVLVEEFVRGREIEVGVLGNRSPIASIPGEIVVTHNEWYDYEAKYDEGEMDLLVPPRISEEQIERAQELAVRAFVATDCEGMARADMFVREDGEVLVNELNTIPGFTATSVYAKLFDASGIRYHELLDRLVDLALERHERRSRLRY
jgi:D-alanine-D-alanine ligase